MSHAIITPTLPAIEIDPSVGDTLGDDILLESARTAKVATVAGGGRPAPGLVVQSASVRAWTMGGNVD